MVEDDSPACGQALLRGSADFALVGRDVVYGFVERVDAHGGERVEDPLVEELIRLFVVEPCDQRQGCVQRERDAVPAFHEHGAATRDPAHHLDPVAFGARGVDFVLEGLERTDDGRLVLPFPESHGRLAAAGGDFAQQNFVECNVFAGGADCVVDDFPCVVVELGGSGHAAFERPGDVGGRHALQVGSQGLFAGFNEVVVDALEGLVEAGCDVSLRIAQVDAFERGAEGGEGLFGFEEEVAGDDDVLGLAVFERPVNDDEFAAGNFPLRLECACLCCRPCLSHCGPLLSVPAT